VDGQAPDLHSVLGGTIVRTPGLERLAARGTWFTRAYCEAPGCCPSRTALLTGVHAARSGIYYNNHRYRQATSAIAQATLLPQHFMRHGYLSAGFGFIAHGHTPAEDTASYSPGYAKIFDRRDAITHRDADLMRHIRPGSLTKMFSGSWNWGVLPDDWDREDPTKLQQDTEQANGLIELLGAKHDRPFFATCGFWRPHVSWTVPQRYFDRFPLESIELPAGYRADDLADVPKAARWLATHRGEHEFIVKNGLWKKCLQAYYASVAYADEQIDRVLRALEASAYRDNTIVVFASDHGWHNGEKDHWSKFYLSEQACGVRHT
jgi:arylsulfatase A-like enzyme